MRSNVVVCRVIISVILVIGVVIYNIVIQPACDFKYCGIAACRNAWHILDPVWHWQLCPFVTCNKIVSLKF